MFDLFAMDIEPLIRLCKDTPQGIVAQNNLCKNKN